MISRARDYAVAAALVGMAVLSVVLFVQAQMLRVRLSESEIQRERAKAEIAERVAAAETKHRRIETELSTRTEKLTHELAEKDRQLAARAAAARRSDAGLRDEIARLNGRPVPQNPELAAAAGEARAARELLGACSQRYTELAREADELRDQVIGLQAFVQNVCRAGQSVSGDLTEEASGQ